MIMNTPDEIINQTSKYISEYWEELIKPAINVHKDLPISNSYISPSIKFNALFYWDTYFQNLGLVIDDKYNLAQKCVENFIDEINEWGFIPNFNGPGWLSRTRSQPAFFCAMIHDLYAVSEDINLLKTFIDPLESEYNYWTNPPKKYKFGLSRYYDTSFWSKLQPYSSIAESGWDITNRFRYVKKSLPVDLNCLLYLYERDIPRFLEIIDELDKSNNEKKWNQARDNRKNLINKYMWDEKREFFYDYSVKSNRVERSSSLAGFYPMWVKIITQERAEKSAKKALEFLKPGGFVSTLDKKVGGFLRILKFMGLQWCYPIGWAPLQWIVNKGLCNYNFDYLAAESALKWLSMVSRVYEKKNLIYEKYDVVNESIEDIQAHYKMHTGFGWTNAVFQALLTRIIFGIEPKFPNSIEFCPRIPLSWTGNSFSISLNNFPKIGLNIKINIESIDKDENKMVIDLETNKSISMELKFLRRIDNEFKSILINGEENIDEFKIIKFENSIENKFIAYSKNTIPFKKGKNTISI
ncbi:MAG: hypothetical protein EU549_00575 [Promethearchaeota archaeon]|nr:MAG: hypothetical protein EU549_00575 [Candidatus Lokiarchaeota archaeon]